MLLPNRKPPFNKGESRTVLFWRIRHIIPTVIGRVPYNSLPNKPQVKECQPLHLHMVLAGSSWSGQKKLNKGKLFHVYQSELTEKQEKDIWKRKEVPSEEQDVRVLYCSQMSLIGPIASSNDRNCTFPVQLYLPNAKQQYVEKCGTAQQQPEIRLFIENHPDFDLVIVETHLFFFHLRFA